MVFEFEQENLRIKTKEDLVRKVLTSIPIMEIKAVKEFADGGSVEEFEKIAKYCSQVYIAECSKTGCAYEQYLINTMDTYNVLSCDEEADLDDVIFNVLKTKDFAIEGDKDSPYKIKPSLFKHILREVYVPGMMQHSTLKKLDELFIDSVMHYVLENKTEEELEFYDEMSHNDIVQHIVLHMDKNDVTQIRKTYKLFLKDGKYLKVV
ncbi:MAG: hypothetical protein PHU51_02495 [Candidatus Nanoarchaeia archaeon]|nr:hypothetical protein [Candidatus Nanoarchaeia archaeon]